MTTDPGLLIRTARETLSRWVGEGWLPQADRPAIDALESARPGDLFEPGAARPLVVGLFGGTGVGKSSLLNRLAGRQLARVGVERPTSREVTLFVHDQVRLADLPPDLPVDRTRVVRHQDAARAGVAWVDAPDIDSAEAENRALTLSWVPHIDLLIYVVSPERYRDDVGWRVLRERGGQHGWMFVMNRWDEGHPRQLDDLRSILARAGFEQPLLLRTSCALPPRPCPTPDEFAEIERTIAGVLAEHGVRELDRLGWRVRMGRARALCTAAAATLGDDAQWSKVRDAVAARMDRAADTIAGGLEFRLRSAAARLVAGHAPPSTGLLDSLAVNGPLARLRTAGKAAAPNDISAAGPLPSDGDPASAAHLWDDWADEKIREVVAAVEVEAGRLNLPAVPIAQALSESAAGVSARVVSPMRDLARRAMVAPGTRGQRWMRRVTGFMTAALPVAALTWVAVTLVGRFHAASSSGSAFLGSDFLIHSAMLVLAAWLIPFLIDRWLRPSLAASIEQALRSGMMIGLRQVRDEWIERVGGVARDAETRRAELAAIERQLATESSAASTVHGPTLSRLLRSEDAPAGRASAAADQ